jgi:hypothetical protein
MKFSLAHQIEEVEREIALRKSVYAALVASGKMRQSIAEFHLQRLEAVRDTLLWLQRNEVRIKELIGGADASNRDHI